MVALDSDPAGPAWVMFLMAADLVWRPRNSRNKSDAFSGRISRLPQGLKPVFFGSAYGAAEAAPLQNISIYAANLRDTTLAVFLDYGHWHLVRGLQQPVLQSLGLGCMWL